MHTEKKNRIRAYSNEKDKKRAVAGEMLARKMLSSYHNIPQEKITFKIGENGKPFAANCSYFNISHSADMVVCCVSDNLIGIDVEFVKPCNPKILRKLCTDTDLVYILGDVDIESVLNFTNEQLYKFYEVWTAKEAYFKCIGTGINNLKSISLNEITNVRKTYNVENYIITIIESNPQYVKECGASLRILCGD